jgi:hypothetical protein
MSTTVWGDVLPLITPEVVRCPEATIKEYLPIVASDFFGRTYLWREELGGFNTVAGQSTYDIASPFYDAVIESVQWLKVEDKKLHHTDERLIKQEFNTSTGQPTHFWVVNDTAVRLFYTPDSVLPITGEVVLKPKRTARGMPGWVTESWVDTIVSGTIYRLCRIRDKDWSDPEFAEMHRRLYEQGVTNSRIRDVRGVDLRVQMKRF